MGSIMNWLLAWIFMFLLLYVLSRTRAGHTIIYYVSWMLVLLLVVTHADQVKSLLTGGNF